MRQFKGRHMCEYVQGGNVIAEVQQQGGTAASISTIQIN